MTNTKPEWEKIARGMLQNEMVEAQFIDKLVDFLKETVEKHGYNKYIEGLEQGHRDGEKMGAERAVEYIEDNSAYRYREVEETNEYTVPQEILEAAKNV